MTVAFDASAGRAFNAYFRFIMRWRRAVVGFWLVVMAVSCVVGPGFLTLGNDNQDAPPGTRAYDDQQVFLERFARKSKELPVLVVASCDKGPDCDLTKDKDVREFAKKLFAETRAYNASHGNVLSLQSWYELDHTALDDVKAPFMSSDKSTTFMTVIESSNQLTKERYAFIGWLNDKIAELNPDDAIYDMGTTGFDVMASEGVDATADQLKRVDSFTVPLAMLLLGYMVRSWRLLLVAFMNMGTSIMMGFAVMVVLIKGVGLPRPESASAQLMEVMTLSLSIDYALFLNRRVRDEVKKGSAPDQAVYMSMLNAGHVVLMSGLTILAVFLGFLFLPARVVRMDGLSCAIGVSSALLVALTNTPALILCFPRFFTTFDGCCGYGADPAFEGKVARVGRERDDLRDDASDDLGAALENGTGGAVGGSGTALGVSLERDSLLDGHSPLLDAAQRDEANGDGGFHDDEHDEVGAGTEAEAEAARKRVHPMYRGARFRFTKFITRWPVNIITIIVLNLMVVPLALQVRRLNVNEDVLGSIPRGSKSGDTFRRMFKEFPGGSFSPFYVVATEPRGKSIMNRHMWTALYEMGEALVAETECTADSVSNPAYVGGKHVPLLEAEAMLAVADSALCRSRLAPKLVCGAPLAYKFLFDQSVNDERDAVLTTLIVPFFPFAQKSSKFIDQTYSVMERFDGHHNIGLHLCGFEVGFDAIERHVYHLFPMLVIITLCAVFTVLGVMLRSAFVPFRLALTLILPLAAVFGLAVLVYQDGILENLSEATKPTDGFFWYVPILITSMVIGLALDYDIFLISRIQEHRAGGYDAQAAICKATCETGGTIGAAGLIMTACFGGMLLASQSTINACGWLLSTAVLFDTFVVNTTLVPAIMSIGDSIAWWPAKMPMTDLITLDHPEFTGMAPGAIKPANRADEATRLTAGSTSSESDAGGAALASA